MLSIGALGSGQGNYYLDLASEDYYFVGGEPLGKWYGCGIAALGLSGTVEREALRNLLHGVSPAGERPLIQNAGEANHQAGWDLTFSAPKSVSVLWAVSDVDARQVIQEAHSQSVKKALDYLQDEVASTRRGKGGIEREKVGLLIATFEHGTSRMMDPQLHTHAIILNVGVTLCDGKTRTIESQPFYSHKMIAGALYRAELAAELARRLGLQSERQRTWFELKGIPKRLIEEFSKRRTKIEAFLSERGLTSASASAYASLATREVKGHAARSELFPQWRQVGLEYNFTQKDAWNLYHKQTERDGEAAKRDAIQTAIDQIIAQTSYFSERELLRRTAQEAPTYGLDATEVRASVKEALTSLKEIVSLGSLNGEVRYTTREMLDIERQMLTDVEIGRSDDQHTLAVQTVMETLSKRSSLSEEQMRAVWHITTKQGSVQVVSGMAGTGKTQMLAVSREAWERAGYRVIGGAIAGKAAQGLEEGAGIRSDTIAKILKELDHGFDYKPDAMRTFQAEFKYATWQIDGDARSKILGEYHQPTSPLAHELKYATWQISKKQRDFLNYRLERDKYRLDEKTVLVIDEAGMVGTKQMARIIEYVRKGGAKLVLIGDEKQLQPIEAGGPFAALSEITGGAELKDIRRQHEKWARDAVHDFAMGRAEIALRAYAEHGLLTVAEDRTTAIQEMIADWKASNVPIGQRLILTSTNQEARNVNRLIQDDRRSAGELGQNRVYLSGETFYEGDSILFTRNSRLYGVKNGTLGTIEAIGADRQSILAHFDNGDRRTIDLRSYGHIRLGYAMTTHKAQGVTAEHIFALAGGSMQDRELSYVQTSRARGETHIYTDQVSAGKNLTLLARQMRHSRRKDMALTLAIKSKQEPRIGF